MKNERIDLQLKTLLHYLRKEEDYGIIRKEWKYFIYIKCTKKI